MNLETVQWMLLDLNSYFASCEQQQNPKLRGRPVAVVPFVADTTCCLAASYEAKAHGIKTGTQVGDAKKMCPGLILVPANHKVYVQYHEAILEAVDKCWPVTNVLSIDEVACELTGSHQNLEKALKLSQLMKDTIKKEVGPCLTSSIGLSSNQFLAKVASDMKKPDGLTVLLKEKLPQSLFHLKLRDFPGIGHSMEQRLLMRGILTVEQLCNLSQNQMHSIWGGVGGDRFYKWLRGEEIKLPHTKDRSMGHQHVLEPKLRTANGAHQALKELLLKAAVRVRKKEFFTRHMTVHAKFIYPNSSRPNTYWDVSTSFEETQDSLFLLGRLKHLLKSWPLGGTPLRVGVVLSDFVPYSGHQLSFFENPIRTELMQSLDEINLKYGKKTVHFGAVHDNSTRDPKIAFSRVPELDEYE